MAAAYFGGSRAHPNARRGRRRHAIPFRGTRGPVERASFLRRSADYAVVLRAGRQATTLSN